MTGDIVTGDRTDTLARLDFLAGERTVEAWFPGDQPAPAGAAGDSSQVRSRFEWTLDRQFLLQRTKIPIQRAPDSLTIASVDPRTGAYTQQYHDSRGVARLHATTLAGGVWTLTREPPHFTPLDFRQRFTGIFSEDGKTISGAWGKRLNGSDWEHDFLHRLPQGRLT